MTFNQEYVIWFEIWEQMTAKKLLVLNKTQIQQKIDRMAYQVLEDNLSEKEIITDWAA